MWNYNDSMRAYTNGNQVLRFYKSITIKKSKNNRFRNSSDTRHRLYIEVYEMINGVGRNIQTILDKSIKGESSEANQKIEIHKDKIVKYAKNHFGIDNVKWYR